LDYGAERMMEQWKDIVGYEGFYQVSDKGRVRSVDRVVTQQGRGKAFAGQRKGRILKQRAQNGGYMLVWLSKQDKKKKAVTVHRLVAQAFIDNPNNYGFVNHKDGHKNNNTVQNLEWCTKSQNTKHAYQNNLMKAHNMVSIKCFETGEKFCSIKDAAYKHNITPECIGNMLHGRTKTAGGYTWIKL
jgi:hypothetical protein